MWQSIPTLGQLRFAGSSKQVVAVRKSPNDVTHVVMNPVLLLPLHHAASHVEAMKEHRGDVLRGVWQFEQNAGLDDEIYALGPPQPLVGRVYTIEDAGAAVDLVRREMPLVLPHLGCSGC
jgi:hypothetical protein